MRPRGIPRGKRDRRRRGYRSCRAASMRPRGIPRGKPARRPRRPGRNRRFNEAAGNTPRKTRGTVHHAIHHSSASMRPRGIPRGKLMDRRWDRRLQLASMRPRGIPRGKPAAVRPNAGAEHSASMRPRGIPRGKRLRGLLGSRCRHASMRPRGIPRGKPAVHRAKKYGSSWLQ